LGNPDNLDELLKAHNVKLVWLETPSNPLLRLVDIKALAAKAKAAGALVGIDNTFATPYLQQPLDMGCDFVFHSATKYLCGHSDVLMGVVVAKTKELAQPLHDMMVHTGAIAGPMDCWLVLR
ncbi:TPA: aminotransferase class V-fold PLP-dependent enzyme, partial [Neisseria meningitidis]